MISLVPSAFGAPAKGKDPGNEDVRHTLLWSNMASAADEGNTQQPQSNQLINISFSYLVDTWPGRLKIAELVMSLLCGACAASILSTCPGHYSFLGFVAWTTLINVLIDVVLHVIGLWDRLFWVFHHPAVMLALCTVACLAFLIGASLAASCARQTTNYNTASASSVFGFFCLILFAIETFLHFQKYRSMESEARRQSSEETGEASGGVV